MPPLNATMETFANDNAITNFDDEVYRVGNPPLRVPPDDDADRKQSDDGHESIYEIYAVIAMLSVLSVVGTIGNVVVLYVFSRPSKRDRACPSASATVYIVALAAVDLVTCVLVIPSTVYVEWVEYRTNSDCFCKLYQFLVTSNVPFSAFIIVAIAFDRYFCICHPLSYAVVANGRRARCVVLSLAAAACALGVIVAASFSIYHVIDGGDVNSSVAAAAAAAAAATNAAGVFGGEADSRRSSFDGDVTESAVAGRQIRRAEMPGDGEHVGTTTEEAAVASSLARQTSSSSYYTNTGYCGPNYSATLGEEFMWYYHRAHTLVYCICLLTVVVLYSLIYRSVLVRRARRRQRLGVELRPRPEGPSSARGGTPPVAKPTASTAAAALLTVPYVAADRTDFYVPDETSSAAAVRANASSTSTRLERLRLSANTRTAAMLFVVTVVFVLTFTPAELMSMELVPYRIMLFYVYFINNVANPFVYSFMNRYFRDELESMFCRFKVAAAVRSDVNGASFGRRQQRAPSAAAAAGDTATRTTTANTCHGATPP